MIVKSAEIECRGPMMKTSVPRLRSQHILDEQTLNTTSVMGSRWIPHTLKKPIVWARMKVKSAKWRSFVMKKGKTADNFRFSLSQTPIFTLSQCPVKTLGNIFDSTLRYVNDFQAQ